MAKMIEKNKVNDLLLKLSEFDVYAPVKDEGIVFYRKLDGQPELDFQMSRKPPKDVFFPQTEKMFDLEMEKGSIKNVKDVPAPDKPILLFGIRPCDARAIIALDKLFSWDYVDPYYVNKRENATIISLSCTQPFMPMRSCFCTSVGGDPGSTDGSDMLFTDIGDNYFAEPLTLKGEAIIEKGSGFFSEATEADEAKAGEQKEQARATITRKLDLEGVPEALEATFDHDYWKGFSDRCIGCGICTLLCPTCHCFDICDVQSRGKVRRERTWDSCQYPYYSVHASGHNPRPEKKHRQRNRMYHKFLYSSKNLDVLECVGCGRCIVGCPVNIDIIEVIEGAKEVNQGE